MWNNMNDMMETFFSSSNKTRASSRQHGESPFGSGPFGSGLVPPGVPDWITQFMASPFGNTSGQNGEEGSTSPFGNMEKLTSQWPFSTMGHNPFSMFQNSQQQAKPPEQKRSRPAPKRPSSTRSRRRRPTRPF